MSRRGELQTNLARNLAHATSTLVIFNAGVVANPDMVISSNRQSGPCKCFRVDRISVPFLVFLTFFLSAGPGAADVRFLTLPPQVSFEFSSIHAGFSFQTTEDNETKTTETNSVDIGKDYSETNTLFREQSTLIKEELVSKIAAGVDVSTTGSVKGNASASVSETNSESTQTSTRDTSTATSVASTTTAYRGVLEKLQDTKIKLGDSAGFVRGFLRITNESLDPLLLTRVESRSLASTRTSLMEDRADCPSLLDEF